MISLIVSILAIGLIIAVHELGHLVAALLCGVGVVEFSIGFGPVLVSGRRGETLISLRAIPFGGACVMAGEDANAGDSSFPGERLFSAKPAWQRFIIVAAGPLANFILAFLMALVIVGSYGYDRSTVLAVDEGFPMAEAGVGAGDTITGLGTGGRLQRVETARDIELFLLEHREEVDDADEIRLRYMDTSGIEHTAYVSAVYDDEAGAMRLGFSYSYAYLPAEGIADTVYYSLYDVRYCIRSALISLKLILTGRVGAEDVMGPVGMVAFINDTVDEAAGYSLTAAFMSLLELMILISGSLGAMNLLPIPALDGGRLLFIIIEMLTGRAVPARLEGMVHLIGFGLLFALMILIMFHDTFMLLKGV